MNKHIKSKHKLQLDRQVIHHLDQRPFAEVATTHGASGTGGCSHRQFDCQPR